MHREIRAPREHAVRLLHWFQIECNTDSPTFGQAYEVSFAEVGDVYRFMCEELNWQPESWLAVARHFTPLTGGKRYRRAFNHKTGRRDAKERVYKIPAVRDRRRTAVHRFPATPKPTAIPTVIQQVAA